MDSDYTVTLKAQNEAGSSEIDLYIHIEDAPDILPQWDRNEEIIFFKENLEGVIPRLSRLKSYGDSDVSFYFNAHYQNQAGQAVDASSLFNFDSTNGELSFIEPPDYESGIIAYYVTLVAKNLAGEDSLLVTINIVNRSDIPPKWIRNNEIVNSEKIKIQHGQTQINRVSFMDSGDAPVVYLLSAPDTSPYQELPYFDENDNGILDIIDAANEANADKEDTDGDLIIDDFDIDDDGDGIPDIADAKHPSNAGSLDSDGDGIIDSADAGSNPESPDIDGDGIINQYDIGDIYDWLLGGQLEKITGIASINPLVHDFNFNQDDGSLSLKNPAQFRGDKYYTLASASDMNSMSLHLSSDSSLEGMKVGDSVYIGVAEDDGGINSEQNAIENFITQEELSVTLSASIRAELLEENAHLIAPVDSVEGININDILIFNQGKSDEIYALVQGGAPQASFATTLKKQAYQGSSQITVDTSNTYIGDLLESNGLPYVFIGSGSSQEAFKVKSVSVGANYKLTEDFINSINGCFVDFNTNDLLYLSEDIEVEMINFDESFREYATIGGVYNIGRTRKSILLEREVYKDDNMLFVDDIDGVNFGDVFCLGEGENAELVEVIDGYLEVDSIVASESILGNGGDFFSFIPVNQTDISYTNRYISINGEFSKYVGKIQSQGFLKTNLAFNAVVGKDYVQVDDLGNDKPLSAGDFVLMFASSGEDIYVVNYTEPASLIKSNRAVPAGVSHFPVDSVSSLQVGEFVEIFDDNNSENGELVGYAAQLYASTNLAHEHTENTSVFAVNSVGNFSEGDFIFLLNEENSSFAQIKTVISQDLLSLNINADVRGNFRTLPLDSVQGLEKGDIVYMGIGTNNLEYSVIGDTRHQDLFSTKLSYSLKAGDLIVDVDSVEGFSNGTWVFIGSGENQEAKVIDEILQSVSTTLKKSMSSGSINAIVDSVDNFLIGSTVNIGSDYLKSKAFITQTFHETTVAASVINNDIRVAVEDATGFNVDDYFFVGSVLYMVRDVLDEISTTLRDGVVSGQGYALLNVEDLPEFKTSTSILLGNGSTQEEVRLEQGQGQSFAETTLSSAASSGLSELEIDNSSGFSVNDKIFIGSGNKQEMHDISQISQSVSTTLKKSMSSGSINAIVDSVDNFLIGSTVNIGSDYLKSKAFITQTFHETTVAASLIENDPTVSVEDATGFNVDDYFFVDSRLYIVRDVLGEISATLRKNVSSGQRYALLNVEDLPEFKTSTSILLGNGSTQEEVRLEQGQGQSFAETALSSDASSGSNELEIDNSSPFAVNDTIFIGSGSKQEKHEISQISQPASTTLRKFMSAGSKIAILNHVMNFETGSTVSVGSELKTISSMQSPDFNETIVSHKYYANDKFMSIEDIGSDNSALFKVDDVVIIGSGANQQKGTIEGVVNKRSANLLGYAGSGSRHLMLNPNPFNELNARISIMDSVGNVEVVVLDAAWNSDYTTTKTSRPVVDGDPFLILEDVSNFQVNEYAFLGNDRPVFGQINSKTSGTITGNIRSSITSGEKNIVVNGDLFGASQKLTLSPGDSSSVEDVLVKAKTGSQDFAETTTDQPNVNINWLFVNSVEGFQEHNYIIAGQGTNQGIYRIKSSNSITSNNGGNPYDATVTGLFGNIIVTNNTNYVSPSTHYYYTIINNEKIVQIVNHGFSQTHGQLFVFHTVDVFGNPFDYNYIKVGYSIKIRNIIDVESNIGSGLPSGSKVVQGTIYQLHNATINNHGSGSTISRFPQITFDVGSNNSIGDHGINTNFIKTSFIQTLEPISRNFEQGSVLTQDAQVSFKNSENQSISFAIDIDAGSEFVRSPFLQFESGVSNNHSKGTIVQQKPSITLSGNLVNSHNASTEVTRASWVKFSNSASNDHSVGANLIQKPQIAIQNTAGQIANFSSSVSIGSEVVKGSFIQFESGASNNHSMGTAVQQKSRIILSKNLVNSHNALTKFVRSSWVTLSEAASNAHSIGASLVQKPQIGVKNTDGSVLLFPSMSAGQEVVKGSFIQFESGASNNHSMGTAVQQKAKLFFKDFVYDPDNLDQVFKELEEDHNAEEVIFCAPLVLTSFPTKFEHKENEQISRNDILETHQQISAAYLKDDEILKTSVLQIKGITNHSYSANCSIVRKAKVYFSSSDINVDGNELFSVSNLVLKEYSAGSMLLRGDFIVAENLLSPVNKGDVLNFPAGIIISKGVVNDHDLNSRFLRDGLVIFKDNISNLYQKNSRLIRYGYVNLDSNLNRDYSEGDQLISSSYFTYIIYGANYQVFESEITWESFINGDDIVARSSAYDKGTIISRGNFLFLSNALNENHSIGEPVKLLPSNFIRVDISAVNDAGEASLSLDIEIVNEGESTDVYELIESSSSGVSEVDFEVKDLELAHSSSDIDIPPLWNNTYENIYIQEGTVDVPRLSFLSQSGNSQVYYSINQLALSYFTVDVNTGEIKFKIAPDFEADNNRVVLKYEEQPSSFDGDMRSLGFEPSNLITSGVNNIIFYSRRCSMINGTYSQISSCYNTHILGGRINYDSGLEFNDAELFVRQPQALSKIIISRSNSFFVLANLMCTGDIVAFMRSDFRLKKNISEINSATKALLDIDPVYFKWSKNQNIYSGNDLGFSAQNIESSIPIAVKTRKNGDKSIYYNKIIPYIVKSIQERQNKINKIKNKIKEIKNGTI